MSVEQHDTVEEGKTVLPTYNTTQWGKKRNVYYTGRKVLLRGTGGALRAKTPPFADRVRPNSRKSMGEGPQTRQKVPNWGISPTAGKSDGKGD